MRGRVLIIVAIAVTGCITPKPSALQVDGVWLIDEAGADVSCGKRGEYVMIHHDRQSYVIVRGNWNQSGPLRDAVGVRMTASSQSAESLSLVAEDQLDGPALTFRLIGNGKLKVRLRASNGIGETFTLSPCPRDEPK